MKYNESKGDLFSLPEYFSLGHCISLCCGMGAGIAVRFQKEFDMRDTLLGIIKNNNLSYPVTIMYDCNNGRKIFNLVTKQNFWNKPTLQSLEICVKEMAKLCKDNNIKYLGLPKIGCGLDRLNWYKVREIIKENFKDMPIQIEVRYLE